MRLAEAAYDLPTVASVSATRVRSLFRMSTGHGVQGSEKVNDSPLRCRQNLRSGLCRIVMLSVGLLLGLVVLPWSGLLVAQDGRKAKFSVQPVYPELARKNNIQGTARLQVLVAADGSIKDIKVLGGSPLLVQAAVDAVKKWKFEAASTETTMVLKFEFKP